MHASALRTLIAGVVALGFSAATLPAQAADVKPLSGADLRAQLSGNTVSGTTAKGEAWVEYYVPGGFIHGLWQGKDRYEGTWSVEGDKFCARYPKSPDSNYCEGIGLDGKTLTYFKDDGSVDKDGGPYQYETGNPEHL